MTRCALFVTGFALAAGAEIHPDNIMFGIQAIAGLIVIVLALWSAEEDA